MSEELEQLGQSLEGIPIPQAQIASGALQIAGEAAKEAEQLGQAIAHSAGLTREESYEGWIPVSLLGYQFVLKPIYQFFLSLMGVMDSLNSWLGGEGHAIESGIKSIENLPNETVTWVQAAGVDVENFFEGRW